MKTLTRLTEAKFTSLESEKNSFIKKRKLQGHLKQKGYEADLINDTINQIILQR